MLEAYQHTQSSEHCFLTLASPAPSFLLDRSDLRLTCYFYLPVPRIKPRSLAPVRQAPYRCPVSPYLFKVRFGVSGLIVQSKFGTATHERTFILSYLGPQMWNPVPPQSS